VIIVYNYFYQEFTSVEKYTNVYLTLQFACRTRVTLKRDGVILDLVPPLTKVSNLIFGRTWIDSPGEMVLTNMTTGDKVVLYFQPCGWFGYGYFTF
jgi:hypothetical protein